MWAANVTAEQLYAVYQSRDYFRLDAELGDLNQQDPHRGFFEGQLDAAFLRDHDADQKLRQFLQMAGMEGDWRKDAWFTLATMELRGTEYNAAADDLARGLAEPSAHFNDKERSREEGFLAMIHLLAYTPPQTRTDQSGASAVNANWNTRGGAHGGLLYVDCRVNGLTEEAVFDTDATLNIASESFANRHGLHVIAGRSGGTTPSGRVVGARFGLADNVNLGKMQFQHVPFQIVKDDNLSFIGSGIGMIIGLPLIIPLEHIRTSFRDGTLLIGLPSDTRQTSFSRDRNLALMDLTF